MKFTSPNPAGSLCGEISVPADKSITHRSILFSSLARGKSTVRVQAMGRDNFASARVMTQLGARIGGSLPRALHAIATDEGLQTFTATDSAEAVLEIESQGLAGFRQPSSSLYCGNSGTTARLLTGILAGCNFAAELTGDASLSRRPFRRVQEPLTQMGAHFSGDKLPLTVRGGALKGIRYESPKASAQVKSAVLLAGLQADGPTEVIEPARTRDHTERMLQAMGCVLEEAATTDGRWSVRLPRGRQGAQLKPFNISVPGDLSSAAFFLVAGAINPGSSLTIRNVGINPTRTGVIDVLRRMGAKLDVQNSRTVGGELVADLQMTATQLRGAQISAADVVLAIDEIPVLAVAAAVAEGVTIIRGAEELRVKESDRLASIATLLKTYGCSVVEHGDGLDITGRPDLVGSREVPATKPWEHSGDHRIEMCGAILEYAVSKQFAIADAGSVETSFPTFVYCFQALS